MRFTIENYNIEGYEVNVYLPPEYNTSNFHYAVLYINGADNIIDIAQAIEPHFSLQYKPFIMVNVKSNDWGADYTPWVSPPLNKSGEEFKGEADRYIKILTGTIKLFIDKSYRTIREPESTALIGYSLAGLAALYTLYSCDCFGRIGSLSGSLWYDGWRDFVCSNTPVNKDAKVYLSLGLKESNSRNARMATVGECTEKNYYSLKEQLTSNDNIKLQYNNGGHFTEIVERFEKAILWLMSDININLKI
ncbi:alpha/beta hydrolase [Clostridium manihotivorum]|uniref:Esterase n=1 Tax=Clostridium manihotivorum TaxID=2320868 RepID=A0A3R5R0K2_9CLOT|nr:alpha/beta hydrolase-fold protein [Clostridium manihotivorum]QAA33846.1 esterase [Clostridium manihotivorum]